MKKISILIPTYNESDNIVQLCAELTPIMENDLSKYDYEIVFIDNASIDNTQTLIEEECKKNKKVKAIFNQSNFGQSKSPFHGLTQTSGDCTILLNADFQDPLDLIPKFVKEWENGNNIVIGIKNSSKENKIIRFFRTCYYKLIKKMSETDMIEHFTGFGLYDKSFIATLSELNDPTPFLRGLVAELGGSRKEISYTQEKRRAGKSSNNFLKLFDLAMLSFTSYTKAGLRIAIIGGAIFSGISLVVALVYLILKLVLWNNFPMGMAPVLIGVFTLGSIQIFFLGLIGEYIIAINERVKNRPLVIEKRRINF